VSPIKRVLGGCDCGTERLPAKTDVDEVLENGLWWGKGKGSRGVCPVQGGGGGPTRGPPGNLVTPSLHFPSRPRKGELGNRIRRT